MCVCVGMGGFNDVGINRLGFFLEKIYSTKASISFFFLLNFNYIEYRTSVCVCVLERLIRKICIRV